MSLLQQLQERSGGLCELTGVSEGLVIYEVPPGMEGSADASILISEHSLSQIEGHQPIDGKYWEQYLPGAMWSEVPVVQVVVWRLLNRLRQESWAAENLDMMYLDEATLTWAQSEEEKPEAVGQDFHKDSNGAVLENGDAVVLTKSLDVKGAAVSARIGTVVKNIRLVADNTEQIEGKIDGQQIVILTRFVRKHNA